MSWLPDRLRVVTWLFAEQARRLQLSTDSIFWDDVPTLQSDDDNDHEYDYQDHPSL